MFPVNTGLSKKITGTRRGIKMNRIEEGCCPRCGFELLDLSAYFCSQCEKAIQKEVRAKVVARKTGTGKRIKMNIGMLGVTQKLKKA